MIRYVATAAIAILVLLGAFLAKRHAEGGGGPGGEGTLLEDRPTVEVTRVAEGRQISVAYRYAGSVSRASLVYELDGSERVADRSDDCKKAIESKSGVKGGAYVTEVNLGGVVPENASNLRVVLEDETGTRILPVVLP